MGFRFQHIAFYAVNCLAFMWGDRAWAEETIVIEESREDDDRAGALKTIPIDGRFGSNAHIADVLSSISGSYVRQLGGLGEYSEVSIRGSSAQQVEVFLNEIPLNPDGNGAINLSEFPLSALSSIQVWRSNPPDHFHSSSIGGVVNMQVEQEKGYSGRYSVGSFGWHRISGQLTTAPMATSIFVDAFHSAGDYAYFSNNATPFNVEDDGVFQRENNQKDQGNILLTGGDSSFQWLHNSFVRQEGLPGTEIIQSLETSLFTTSHLSAVLWKKRGWRSTVWQHLRREIYSDPAGELGQGEQEQQFDAFSHGVTINYMWLNRASFFPSMGAALRNEGYRNKETDDDISIQNRQSLKAFISADTWLGSDWMLATTLRALMLRNAFGSEVEILVVPTPRASILYRPKDSMAMWGTIARNVRPPTTIELFGQRGIMAGNAALLPEKSTLVDCGLSITNLQQTAMIQAAYFHSWNTDHIVLVQNAQRVSIPINFGATTVQGVELMSEINPWPWLQWQLTGTLNHSVNQSNLSSVYGKKLPNVPTWIVQNNTVLHHRGMSAGHTWYFTDESYWDATNWYRAAPRSIHNAFLRFQPKENWPILEIEGRNLSDRLSQEVPIDPLQPELGNSSQSVTDFVGFPLAGRSLLFTIEWSPTLGNDL